MAFHRAVRPAAAGICLLLLAAAATAERKPDAVLTVPEIRDGWVQLFDGGSTFGWTVDGEAKVTDGVLVVGGEKATKLVTVAAFPGGEVSVLADGPPGEGTREQNPRLTPAVGSDAGPILIGKNFSTEATIVGHSDPATQIALTVPAGKTVRLKKLAFRPAKRTPLFNGKDLSGWKPFAGDTKREKSKFAVTAAGELSVKDGPGDLQTEASFADFLLQLECKTNGKGLNSGVFFRCLPGQYQQGYEAQIQNLFNSGDRTKPTDFGTGAIYRRVPARKVVPNDNEWFTLTVLAVGPKVHTWVNGYPTVSWTDDRKPAENARQGQYLKAGPISLQGHDPTTDLLFRHIRATAVK